MQFLVLGDWSLGDPLLDLGLAMDPLHVGVEVGVLLDEVLRELEFDGLDKVGGDDVSPGELNQRKNVKFIHSIG